MAWRRHNRNLTHEVFYDGTTIDGSRLEKGMRDITDDFNDVPPGDIKNRFVAVQYHAGFSPQPYDATNIHRFPWLEIRNQSTVDVYGEVPIGAPHNELRLKGTHVPGIFQNAGSGNRDGTQWAWSRTFAFKMPVVIDALSVMMHVESNGPYQGEDPRIASVDAYEWGASHPQGYSTGDFTSDICVIFDVFNPTTPEDAEMTDVPYTRRRWVVNRELFTLFANAGANPGPAWADMFPVFESGDIADVRPLQGRLLEDKDLNMPIPAGSKARVSIVIPQYSGTIGPASWGTVPWYIQAWSTTLTVLEEVRAR